jgi:hypothetical protein
MMRSVPTDSNSAPMLAVLAAPMADGDRGGADHPDRDGVRRPSRGDTSCDENDRAGERRFRWRVPAERGPDRVY